MKGIYWANNWIFCQDEKTETVESGASEIKDDAFTTASCSSGYNLIGYILQLINNFAWSKLISDYYDWTLEIIIGDVIYGV